MTRKNKWKKGRNRGGRKDEWERVRMRESERERERERKRERRRGSKVEQQESRLLTARERLAPSRDYQFGITHSRCRGMMRRRRTDYRGKDAISSWTLYPLCACFHGETKCIIIAINVRRSIKWEFAIVLTDGKFHSQDLILKNSI